MNSQTGVVRSAERGARGFFYALYQFKEAARRVPAYRDFLRKNSIRPASIKTPEDFAELPLTDKKNYIGKYALSELCWDGELSSASHISSSSGSTGVPYYWPRSERHNDVSGRIFRRIYEDLFETLSRRTLFIDMFALGTWLAGLQFYDGARSVAKRGSRMSIVAAGIEKNTALDAIARLSGSFERVVLSGYPPFIKDVLEEGESAGISWQRMDIKLLLAGESFSEMWRDRVRKIASLSSSDDIINVYGMAEVGVVGHETPLSIALRRNAEDCGLSEQLFHDGYTCPLYQFDPALRYIEAVGTGDLVLTADAGIPLIRYNTRDQGGIVSHRDALLAASRGGISGRAGRALPYVYLRGRRDLSISFYALNIYVENIKRALETSKEGRDLSGLFTMRVEEDSSHDQRFRITVEAARGKTFSRTFAKSLAPHITRVLTRMNAEYAKLHKALGKRAEPEVSVVRYGELETRPGRKHAWVRRQ